jgi:serine phosphatase RsbU (regulator of sigma subunit)/Tfp pilus assembly protein PilF
MNLQIKYIYKITILLLINMLLMEVYVVAQNDKIDSLTSVLKILKSDSIKVKTLYNLYQEYKYTDPKKAEQYINDSYLLATQLNYHKGIAQALYCLGNVELTKGNYNQSLAHYNRSLEIAQKIKDKQIFSNCLNGMGNIYTSQANYTKALEYNKKGLAIRKEINDSIKIGDSYNNMGSIYLMMGDFNQSLFYYLETQKYYEKSASKEKLASLLVNIGIIYNYTKDYAKALEYFNRSLIDNPNKLYIGRAYGNMANVYLSQGLNDKADQSYQKALKAFENAGDKDGISFILINMANNAFLSNRIEHAMKYNLRALTLSEELDDKLKICTILSNIAAIYRKKKYFTKALEYEKQALIISKEIDAKEPLKQSYYGLSDTYIGLGNYDNALKYYKLATAVKDSMFSKEKTTSLSELQTKYETDKKEKEIALLTKDNELKEKSFKEQRIIRFSLIGFVALLIILSFTLYNRYRFKQKANMVLENQKKIIEQKNTMITDSIDSAKSIQDAILPSLKTFHTYFKSSFILYKPKDIVSGDFYWIGKHAGKTICAVVDCTGHGVPGAFMALLGSSILGNVIQKSNDVEPALILDLLHKEIINVQTHGKDSSTVSNGMDIALIIIDEKTNELQYAGAHNSLLLIRNEELIEIKADKISIGGTTHKNDSFKFKNHSFFLQKNDIIYLFSDGYTDQRGGPNRKKFYHAPFKELLTSIHQLEMEEQKQKLDETFTHWKGNEEQTDDILVIGLRFSDSL